MNEVLGVALVCNAIIGCVKPERIDGHERPTPNVDVETRRNLRPIQRFVEKGSIFSNEPEYSLAKSKVDGVANKPYSKLDMMLSIPDAQEYCVVVLTVPCESSLPGVV